jgi:hypothetical protein
VVAGVPLVIGALSFRVARANSHQSCRCSARLWPLYLDFQVLISIMVDCGVCVVTEMGVVRRRCGSLLMQPTHVTRR